MALVNTIGKPIRLAAALASGGRMASLADVIKQSAVLAVNRGLSAGRGETTRGLTDGFVLDRWSTLEHSERQKMSLRKRRRGRRGEQPLRGRSGLNSGQSAEPAR
jgi:hypothetical protein